jgi:hypothetical protein
MSQQYQKSRKLMHVQIAISRVQSGCKSVGRLPKTILEQYKVSFSYIAGGLRLV